MSKGRHAKDSGAWKKVTLVAGVATTGAIPLSVVTAPPAQAASVETWEKIAYCESGGQWNLGGGHADSTGGLQIQTRTWNDFGGQQYAPTAGQATKLQQIAVAEKILAAQGPSAWAVTYDGNGAAKGCNGILSRGGPSPTPPTSTPSKPAPSKPAPGGTYVVQPGDSLFLIAKAKLGDGEKWPSIYKLNRGVIGSNPDMILPDQKLTLPGGTSKAPPASTGSGKSGQVLSFLKNQVGKSYVLGGNGPSVFDCSGLTVAAYKLAGVELPRLSQQQSARGTPVSLSQAQPGDLLYWGTPGSAHHVAVYIGDGKFIGAQNPSVGIVEKSLSYSQPTGARRLF